MFKKGKMLMVVVAHLVSLFKKETMLRQHSNLLDERELSWLVGVKMQSIALSTT